MKGPNVPVFSIPWLQFLLPADLFLQHKGTD